MEMKVQLVETSKLKPYELNAKKHDRKQIENVAESIRQFGWQQPIVVDKDYVIIIGHCRFEAAKLLKLPNVPVHVADDLTEEQVKKLRVIDNKTNESDWDLDMLFSDVGNLKFDGFDIDFGFVEEHKEIEEDDFDIDAAIPDVPIAKRGDIYQLGEHRLMCGDATSKDDVTKLMGGVKADMVFTDPPYGMKKESEGVLNDNLNFDDLLDFNRQWIPLTFETLKDNGSWYCWGTDEPLMDIYSNILKPMKKQKGQNKLTFRNLITWDKGSGQGQLAPAYRMYAIADEKCLFVMMGRQTYGETVDDYWDGFEPIRTALIALRDSLGMNTEEVIKYAGATTCSHWFAKSQWEFPSDERYKIFCDNCLSTGRISKAEYDRIREEYDRIREEYDRIREEYDRIREEWYKTRAYFDNTHDNMNDVWHFNKTSESEREHTGGHATPKPIALCSRAIKSSSREGEIVLDVFGGSGSTLIACEETNRKCYMMELEPKYVDVIIKRWESFTGKKAVKIN